MALCSVAGRRWLTGLAYPGLALATWVLSLHTQTKPHRHQDSLRARGVLATCMCLACFPRAAAEATPIRPPGPVGSCLEGLRPSTAERTCVRRDSLIT